MLFATLLSSASSISVSLIRITAHPTLQGKKVSLRLSWQVDAPNQCGSANKAVYKLVWYWHTCIALRVLRFATQFVTLLATPVACVRAATCVIHATSFISSSVPLHYTTFAAILFASRHGTLSHTQSKAQVMHMLFRKAQATILTGLHSATLRPPFTSVAFSPPAANNFARLACLPQLRVCHGFCLSHKGLMKTKTHAKPSHIT